MGTFVYIMMMILTSLVGLSYFVYGKKEVDVFFMVDGAILMIYPYVIGNVILMVVVGLALIAAPFVARRWM
jgi:hypothetical protein